jgi:predicted permease
MSSLPVLEPLARDLRYAFRMLRKTPGFTIVALVTLAVGIGVNTAVFTVVNALLLKPLPFPDPARLATVSSFTRSARGSNENTSVDGKTFLAIRDNAVTVDVAVSSGGMGGGVNLIANGAAANVEQRRVSAGYFNVLGIRPFLGREFTADEDRTGGQPVAVLSYGLWTRVFGSDRNIVGQAIRLRGEPYTVVGVMPHGFTTGVPTDVWTPLRPSTSGEGGGSNYGMIARVRPNVTWDQANAEINQLGAPAIMRDYENAETKDKPIVQCSLVPLQQQETADIRQPLLMLWGAVGLVLLIACVNIAGLLLARSGSRTREIATRMALGSGRPAVIRQLLVESALLALGGGALGLAVGWGVLRALIQLSADVFPLGYPVQLDVMVLSITLLVALVTSVFFGLVPALHASRVDVQAALAESGTRAVAGGRGRRARSLLVVGEVAMGVVLLVSAGLLVRTFVHLRSLSPGFDPSSVTTATISLQDKRYEDPVKVNRLFADTLAGIRRQPGVEAAGVALGLPYTRLLNLGSARWRERFRKTGRNSNVSYITPGYVEALRLPVRRGAPSPRRTRTDSVPWRSSTNSSCSVTTRARTSSACTSASPAVARDRRCRRERARDVLRSRRRGAPTDRAVCDLHPRDADPGRHVQAGSYLVLAVLGRALLGSIAGLPDAIRQSVAAVDPLLPIAKMESMAAVQAASLAQQRFMMSVVVGLGVVALLLAAIGIHG